MNSRILITLAALLFVSLGTATDASEAKNIHHDKNKNYRLELPSGWITRPDVVADLVSMPKGKAPIHDAAAIPNIKVVVRDMPSGKTLDEICDLAQKQWAQTWKVESDKHVKTGNTPTRRLVLIQEVPFLKTKILKAFAQGSGKYYIISCSDSPEHFVKSVPMFEKVLDSLVLK